MPELAQLNLHYTHEITYDMSTSQELTRIVEQRIHNYESLNRFKAASERFNRLIKEGRASRRGNNLALRIEAAHFEKP